MMHMGFVGIHFFNNISNVVSRENKWFEKWLDVNLWVNGSLLLFMIGVHYSAKYELKISHFFLTSNNKFVIMVNLSYVRFFYYSRLCLGVPVLSTIEVFVW